MSIGRIGTVPTTHSRRNAIAGPQWVKKCIYFTEIMDVSIYYPELDKFMQNRFVVQPREQFRNY